MWGCSGRGRWPARLGSGWVGSRLGWSMMLARLEEEGTKELASSVRHPSQECLRTMDGDSRVRRRAPPLLLFRCFGLSTERLSLPACRSRGDWLVLVSPAPHHSMRHAGRKAARPVCAPLGRAPFWTTRRAAGLLFPGSRGEEGRGPVALRLCVLRDWGSVNLRTSSDPGYLTCCSCRAKHVRKQMFKARWRSASLVMAQHSSFLSLRRTVRFR